MSNQQQTKEDIILISDVLSGEKEAFAQLVERYKTMVFNLCYRMTGNRWDADDLSQESFLRAYKNLEKFRVGEKFSTWLYTIALNLCRDKAKKRRLVSASLDEPVRGYEDLYPQVSSKEMSSEEILIARDEEESVEKAIMSLRPEYRVVVLLRHQRGLSYDEISQVIDSPVHTVKVRLHRARKKLKGFFEGAGLR